MSQAGSKAILDAPSAGGPFYDQLAAHIAGSMISTFVSPDPDESAPSAVLGAGGNHLRPETLASWIRFFLPLAGLRAHQHRHFGKFVVSPAPHSSILMLEEPLTKVESAHWARLEAERLPPCDARDSSGQLAPDVLLNIFASKKRRHAATSALVKSATASTDCEAPRCTCRSS